MSLRYTTCAAELAFLVTCAATRAAELASLATATDDGEEADDSLEAIDVVVDMLEAVGEINEVGPK